MTPSPLLVVVILSLPLSAFAAGPCVDCSHRGKSSTIIAEHEAHPNPYSPYNGRRASGSGRGIGGTSLMGHFAEVPVPVTREYAPYTHPGMQRLDGGVSGYGGHSGGHGTPPSGR